MAGDIFAPYQQWVEVYARSGIDMGTAVIVQNKAVTPVLIFESSAEPSDQTTGFEVGPREAVFIDAGSPGIWVRAGAGPARLFVQEA